MESREFFDTIYALWAKTTLAKDGFWMYDEDTEHYDAGPGTYNVWAVDAESAKDIDAVSGRKFVASFDQNEADADFITAVHGCFPDLIRALHTAFDEADRAIYERDSQECRIAELELELDEIKNYISEEEER